MPDRSSSPLARTHVLDSGAAVRLRLARASDAGMVAELLGGCGVRADELELRRLLSFDPARRAVLCAICPLDGADRVVGIGAIALSAGADVDTLVADRDFPGVAELLGDVLRHRVASRSRRVA